MRGNSCKTEKCLLIAYLRRFSPYPDPIPVPFPVAKEKQVQGCFLVNYYGLLARNVWDCSIFTGALAKGYCLWFYFPLE